MTITPITPSVRSCLINALLLTSILTFCLTTKNSTTYAVGSPQNSVEKAAEKSGYQKPSKDILDILNILPPPTINFSPDLKWITASLRESYPSVAELARPMVRLAGHRLDPLTNGPHRPLRHTRLVLRPLAGPGEVGLELPPGFWPGLPRWSTDDKFFALSLNSDRSIEVGIARPGYAKIGKDSDKDWLLRVPGVQVNAFFPEPMRWLPDNKTLLVRAIPVTRKNLPTPATAPLGPVVQEGSGKSAPTRTYQDLLRTPHDADLFDYYATSQLVLIDAATGTPRALGQPGIIRQAEPSPDGRFVLVHRIVRPYSYSLPSAAFPGRVEVWDLSGKVVKTVVEQPLADRVPIEGVRTGPREIRWVSVRPATLEWVEALDQGDPNRRALFRDKVMLLDDPFTGTARELARTYHRFLSMYWRDPSTALLAEFERERRRQSMYLLHVRDGLRLLWDRSIQDRYNDPGTPLLRQLPGGHTVVQTLDNAEALLLTGPGASPKGDRPFLDLFDLKTKKTKRLFQSPEDAYEVVLRLASPDGSRFLTRHETPTSPANYRLRHNAPATDKEIVALTNFMDPTPQVRKIQRRRIIYQRADKVQLSFTLHLPPDYKEGTRLPTLLWAYPREFTNPDLASQVSGSTQQFTTLTGASHLFFPLAGYAVLDGATMPVVGSPDKANDTFVEQIVASAKAAIDTAVKLGVTDPERVGVGGHSYGAFMTANLLAHSDLFRAGIARSGAYNRTLTPFGFQNERRTFWEAPEVYYRMSPFLHAEKIDEPVLLIHGEADNNPGTFPMQSERLYQAIRGNGGTVRYVSLPYEGHGYQARESIEHTLHEMLTWFDRYVKPQREEIKKTNKK